MKLKVLGRYTNTARNIDVYPGDEIDVPEALAEWLANDAPGCFENPNAPAKAHEQQPDPAAQREADAIQDRAAEILDAAQRQAAETRAAAHVGEDRKPFDLPPDGTTLRTDATPPVVTGPDSGVEVTHRADAEEQRAVLDEQAALAEEEAEEEDESDKTKAPKKPARDKMVRGAPEQK
jgi:hypothetical protein